MRGWEIMGWGTQGWQGPGLQQDYPPQELPPTTALDGASQHHTAVVLSYLEPWDQAF